MTTHEDTINRHAEAAEREINYTSARNAFAGFGMGLIERSHSRTWIISKQIKAAVTELLSRQNDSICQTLGKALGFPWYKDDQANFPGATEENGVFVGDHVAESMTEVAAKEIEKLKQWQREAMSVMAEWDKVWFALGEPGQIGDNIPAACKSEVERREDRITELLENFKPLTQQYAAAFRAVGILIEREQYEEASLWKDRYEDTMREIDSILKGRA